MKLSAAALTPVFEAMPPGAVLRLAFSGGLDSTVLAHLLSSVPHPAARACGAVHVHHGISPHADAWVGQCRQFCQQWHIPLTVLHVKVQAIPGTSLEALAREARYRALESVTGSGDIMLTAHHGDDQAETFLLQALRGSGVPGLAGMPRQRPLGAGTLMRPLLSFNRRQIHEYALTHGLCWVDDDSNALIDYDRNYLRHQVLPSIATRWPGVAGTLSRAARHQAEARQLLAEVAAADLQVCRGASVQSLRVSALATLSYARMKNLVRHWLWQQGAQPPGTAKLAEILRQTVHGALDAQPLLQWRDGELRRYQDCLYLVPPMSPHDAGRVYSWNVDRALALPGIGQLTVRPAVGQGLNVDLSRDAAAIRFRTGGEMCQPQGRRHHQSLKKLVQAWGIPPWLRDRIPLLYIENKLAAIIGHCYCEPFTASGTEPGLIITLEREGMRLAPREQV